VNEPEWLGLAEVLRIHARQLAVFGGPSGLRDQGALESALGRPQHRWAYEQPDMAELGAAYAFGIARNHPFIDGNKRTAFVSARVFLGLNGINLQAAQEDVVATILALAAGELSEVELAAVIRERWT
jgi:death-on-curing protein